MKKLIALILIFNMLVGVCFAAGKEESANQTNDWKKVYKSYIMKQIYNGYELADLDFDGVPELIEYGELMTPVISIFTVKNNKLYHSYGEEFIETILASKGYVKNDKGFIFGAGPLFLIKDHKTGEKAFAFMGGNRTNGSYSEYLIQFVAGVKGLQEKELYYADWGRINFPFSDYEYTFKTLGNQVEAEEYNRFLQEFWKEHIVVNYAPQRLDIGEKINESKVDTFLNGYKDVSSYKSNKILFINNWGGSFFVEQGKVFVKVRGFFAGYYDSTIEWNAEKRVIYMYTTERGMEDLLVPIGKNVLYQGGKEIKLDGVTRIKNGSTYVSIDALSKIYGCIVIWNEKEKTILLEPKNVYWDYTREVGLWEIDKETMSGS